MKRPDITKEKIQEMLNFDLSHSDIARELGTSRQFIWQKYTGYRAKPEYYKKAQKKWREKIKLENPEKYKELKRLQARKDRARKLTNLN